MGSSHVPKVVSAEVATREYPWKGLVLTVHEGQLMNSFSHPVQTLALAVCLPDFLHVCSCTPCALSPPWDDIFKVLKKKIYQLRIPHSWKPFLRNEGKDISRHTEAKRFHYQENFSAIIIKRSSVRDKMMADGNLDQHKGLKSKEDWCG